MRTERKHSSREVQNQEVHQEVIKQEKLNVHGNSLPAVICRKIIVAPPSLVFGRFRGEKTGSLRRNMGAKPREAHSLLTRNGICDMILTQKREFMR